MDPPPPIETHGDEMAPCRNYGMVTGLTGLTGGTGMTATQDIIMCPEVCSRDCGRCATVCIPIRFDDTIRYGGREREGREEKSADANCRIGNCRLRSVARWFVLAVPMYVFLL
jgi:hypothetical protein